MPAIRDPKTGRFLKGSGTSSTTTGTRTEIRGLQETKNKLEQTARDIHGKPMVATFQKAVLLLTRDAKLKSPVDTGRLRSSITGEVFTRSALFGHTLMGVAGTNVKYACILGANTRVITQDGTKTISTIQIGDMVLSQDGKYHRVNWINSFPAIEKPNLIDIEIEWRNDRTHKITVTDDHKILVYRDGRNKWVMAKDLQYSDMLFSRKKIAHNKNTGIILICLNCGKEYNRQDGKNLNKKFCSLECRTEYWNSGNNPHTGMKRTNEAKSKMSQSAIEKFKKQPNLHPNKILSKLGFKTSYEKEIKKWLDENGFEYIEQYKIGKHWVDFYIPETNTVYEADGAYWHKNQSKDIGRDKEILNIIPDVTIHHIHFFDKRFSPIIDENPIENVYYSCTNPGIKSFVNLEQFEAKRIVSISEFDYKQKGDKPALLYDISVENVHSFFANGILVSNSYMEFGTGVFAGKKPHRPPAKYLEQWARRHKTNAYVIAHAIALRGGLKPRKFFQYAADHNRDKIRKMIEDAVSGIVRK